MIADPYRWLEDRESQEVRAGGRHGGNALEDAADLVAFIALQLGLTGPETMANRD